MNERSGIERLKARVPPWGGVVVVLVAAVLSFWVALVLRDVTQDEMGLLGTFRGMLGRAIGVDDPDQFTAHLPLAWFVRLIFQKILGADSVLAWRLHAAIGATVGAVLTWWCLYRRGRPGHAIAAGLLVAANPILSFHAHDATNYALGPMTGALVIIGLSDLADSRPTAPRYLIAGLLLGAANDFFFAFVGLAAVVLSLAALRWSREPYMTRRMALRAWAVVGAVLAVPVIVLGVRLARVRFGDVISPHADVSSLQWSVLDHVAEWYHAFVVAYAEGYRSIAEPDPWLAAGPAVLLAIAVGLSILSRRAPVRTAGLLLALSLLLFVGLTYAFSQVMGHRFPDPPRAYTALIPALAIVWSHALLSPGRRVGVVLFAVFALSHATVSARQVLGVADTQAWAVERMVELYEPGDGLFDAVALSHRLPPELAEVREHNCLSHGPLDADRIWFATFPFRGEPGAVPLCEGFDHWRPLEEGYRVRLHERHDVPSYEKNTNSFLTEASLLLLQRGRGDDRGEPVSMTIQFDHGVLSGARGGQLDVTLGEQPDAVSFTQDLAPTVVLGPIPASVDVLLLNVRPREPGAWVRVLPRFLERPFYDGVAAFTVPVCCEEPVADSSTLSLPPLRVPWIRAGRRLASVVVAAGALLAPVPVFMRWFRRRTD